MTPEAYTAPSLRYADGDVFNGAEANTEVPLQARYGESAGVIERGMYEERRSGTWEALFIPLV